MAIKFNEATNTFALETKNTAYVFCIAHGKYPVHLYYGKKKGEYPEYRPTLKSFQPYDPVEDGVFAYDAMSVECPFFGSGDFRCTSLRVRNADGNSVTNFFYEGYRVFAGRHNLSGLPFAEGDCETLEITLRDTEVTGCVLRLYYTVFADYDVIARYAALENKGRKNVVIEKFMSAAVDIPGREWDLITIHGAYAWEHRVSRTPVLFGNQSVFSRRGASSHNFNPFAALCSRRATEERGEVYAFNLAYSGNFLTEVEQSHMEETRVQLGIGSENFSWRLARGETFETPEAIMTYTSRGIGQMSRNLHRFVRECVMPGGGKAPRPVVLNSWEACYFDIDENVLVKFAAEAKKHGIDMLVMDDGWFGKRVNDRAGLGDWWENPDRFPKGLKNFVERVKKKGVKFGIWIEPENVNPDSDLYRAHPDWALGVPGRATGLSRSQLSLDMGNPAVVEYLKDSFERTLGDVPFDYIKWDTNRHLSNVASAALPADRQGETAHRYMLGVYELMRWFRERFPSIVLETCSGGGGRYDLGMMKYGDLIWTSDVTNPEARTMMQYGASIAYPAATMSCHISNPWGDVDEMKFRFGVATQGMLGYEMHIINADPAVKALIPGQIAEYRSYEDLMREGELYRLIDPKANGDVSAFCYANAERSRIVFTFIQPSGDGGEHRENALKIPCADKTATYVDELTGRRYKGASLLAGIKVKTKKKKNVDRRYFVKES